MYEWFTDWADQHLAVTVALVAARDMSERDVLAAYDADLESIKMLTFDECDDSPDGSRVRIGRSDSWFYTVEHFTTVGASDQTMTRLTAGEGGLSFALACNVGLNSFQGAESGSVTTRFDLGLPAFRYGAAPDRYIDEITDAGLFDGQAAAGSGATLLSIVSGVQITAELLEGPLMSAVLGRSM